MEGHSCAGCSQLQQKLDAQEATAALYKEKLVATHEMLVELSAKKQENQSLQSKLSGQDTELLDVYKRLSQIYLEVDPLKSELLREKDRLRTTELDHQRIKAEFECQKQMIAFRDRDIQNLESKSRSLELLTQELESKYKSEVERQKTQPKKDHSSIPSRALSEFRKKEERMLLFMEKLAALLHSHNIELPLSDRRVLIKYRRSFDSRSTAKHAHESSSSSSESSAEDLLNALMADNTEVSKPSPPPLIEQKRRIAHVPNPPSEKPTEPTQSDPPVEKRPVPPPPVQARGRGSARGRVRARAGAYAIFDEADTVVLPHEPRITSPKKEHAPLTVRSDAKVGLEVVAPKTEVSRALREERVSSEESDSDSSESFEGYSLGSAGEGEKFHLPSFDEFLRPPLSPITSPDALLEQKGVKDVVEEREMNGEIIESTVHSVPLLTITPTEEEPRVFIEEMSVEELLEAPLSPIRSPAGPCDETAISPAPLVIEHEDSFMEELTGESVKEPKNPVKIESAKPRRKRKSDSLVAEQSLKQSECFCCEIPASQGKQSGAVGGACRFLESVISSHIKGSSAVHILMEQIEASTKPLTVPIFVESCRKITVAIALDMSKTLLASCSSSRRIVLPYLGQNERRLVEVLFELGRVYDGVTKATGEGLLRIAVGQRMDYAQSQTVCRVATEICRRLNLEERVCMLLNDVLSTAGYRPEAQTVGILYAIGGVWGEVLERILGDQKYEMQRRAIGYLLGKMQREKVLCVLEAILQRRVGEDLFMETDWNAKMEECLERLRIVVLDDAKEEQVKRAFEFCAQFASSDCVTAMSEQLLGDLAMFLSPGGFVEAEARRCSAAIIALGRLVGPLAKGPKEDFLRVVKEVLKGLRAVRKEEKSKRMEGMRKCWEECELRLRAVLPESAFVE